MGSDATSLAHGADQEIEIDVDWEFGAWSGYQGWRTPLATARGRQGTTSPGSRPFVPMLRTAAPVPLRCARW